MKKIIFILFVALAYINYRFLNIGFLSIHSIDEYAFHGSLLNMYDGLITLDIKKLFSFGFYSYGFGFFFLNLLATAPFFATDNVELSIYIPRIITSLFAVGSLWYIYKIARLYVDKYTSILISLVVITMPGFWKNAFWFHPDWMMTFFIVLSIYFLAKDSWNFKKYFWWASVALGLSLATKIQAITFLPFVFIYLYYDNIRFVNLEGTLQKTLLLLKFFALTFLVFVFVNPYLLHPSGLKAFVTSFKQNMNSNVINHGSNVNVTIGDKISDAIDFYYLDTIMFYAFLIGSFYLMFMLLKRDSKKSIMPIVAIYFVINVIYLFTMVNKSWQHYYLTIFIITPIILVPFIERFSKYRYYLLGILLIGQVSTHASEYKYIYKTGYHPEREISKEQQNIISNSLIKVFSGYVNKDSNILISPYQPFDYNKLGLGFQSLHILYEPLSLNMFQLDAFLEKSITKDPSKFKQINFIVLSKEDIYFDEEKIKARVNTEDYNKALQIIENFNNKGDLGYEKFADNKYFYIWKKVK